MIEELRSLALVPVLFVVAAVAVSLVVAGVVPRRRGEDR